MFCKIPQRIYLKRGVLASAKAITSFAHFSLKTLLHSDKVEQVVATSSTAKLFYLSHLLRIRKLHEDLKFFPLLVYQAETEYS